ncbi:MAG: hypothetical protein QM504_06580 [Pseudomonadota bacterium]
MEKNENQTTIFGNFIGSFNMKSLSKKVDNLSDDEQNKLCESLIQDFNNSGGAGIVQRHESDSVDFLEIFSKQLSKVFVNVKLNKQQHKFCFKLANRLDLSGMETDLAVGLAVANRDKTDQDVDRLVKQLLMEVKKQRKTSAKHLMPKNEVGKARRLLKKPVKRVAKSFGSGFGLPARNISKVATSKIDRLVAKNLTKGKLKNDR